MDCETSKQVTSLFFKKGNRIISDYFHTNYDLWLRMKIILIFWQQWPFWIRLWESVQKRKIFKTFVHRGWTPPLFSGHFFILFLFFCKNTPRGSGQYFAVILENLSSPWSETRNIAFNIWLFL